MVVTAVLTGHYDLNFLSFLCDNSRIKINICFLPTL